MAVYAYEYGNRYPPSDKWCDTLLKADYVGEKQFVCRSASATGDEGRCHYAMNPNCGPNSPGDMVLLFETKGGWNHSGGPELISFDNHGGHGCNVAFNDMQVEFVTPKQLGKLLWRDPGLHTAIVEGNLAKAKSILAEKPELVCLKDASGSPVLLLAARWGHKQILELLLSQGAKMDSKDKRGRTAMHEAAANGHVDIVAYLIDQKAAIDTKDHSGRRALHEAAKAGHRELAEFLFAKGANVNSKDYDGRTALHDAVAYGRKSMAQFLVAKGAKLNTRDYDGYTALHWAAIRGHKNMVGFLLEAGAEINTTDKAGNTPMQCALDQGHQEIAALLRQRAPVE
ncbi:MAG: ankyrin repeat domain-containing protein [Planctomycetota bacterium]